MALRLVEMVIPRSDPKEIEELLKEHSPCEIWSHDLAENRNKISILLPSEAIEPVLEILEKRFSEEECFRIVVLPVEACLPRPKPPAEEDSGKGKSAAGEENNNNVGRLSREELYTDIVDTTKLTKAYVVMVFLSSVVAAIGILRGNVAVVIGAMVIAPLLGPNVALSFATTLGDIALARTALKANIAGILTALVPSILLGVFLTVDIAIPEILSRSQVEIADIVLALVSGSAGALAFTSGLPATLIGVMVAVALLPPLVVFGLLAGSGQMTPALGALLLVVTNIICINLAGVTTFLIQGIRPLSWWEADRARKATAVAIALWVSLLAVLIGVILLARRG